MKELKLWELMRNIHAAITAGYEPALERLCLDAGLEPRQWSTLLAAQTFEPEETTPSHLLVRVPFYASEVYGDRLQHLAQRGLLESLPDNHFRLTEAGRAAVSRFITTARLVMAHLDPLPVERSQRLGSLLRRLVHASLEIDPPPNKWSISLSYKLMPPDEPSLPSIEQSFSCLAAYRDDAHLAVWRSSGLSAMALEELTLFWRGEVSGYDDLCRKLSYRGHSCKVFNTVLEELRHHGFIGGSDEALRLTAAGRVYRTELEDLTNRYFFAPWRALDLTEKEEMSQLLLQLQAGILEGAFYQR